MAPADPSAPKRMLLGRYEALRVLGRGAMGEVLEVRDAKSGQRYALKRVPPELARQSSQLQAIKANFNLVHSLAHPHIAVTRFLESDDATGEACILMDLVRGQDLQTWLNRERERRGDPQAPLPLPLVLGIAEQAASALDYAHAQPIYADDGSVSRYGVLHRDLKPANVMAVDGREHRPGIPYIQLVDFGLAAEIQASILSQTQHVPDVNALAGTPLYMAPEQWLGRRLTRGIDQWALAVMIYEMAEGCIPFPGPTRGELRDQVLNHPPQPPETFSLEAWKALSTAFEKDRSRRYATCGAMVEAVAAAAGIGSSIPGGRASAPPPDLPLRSSPGFAPPTPLAPHPGLPFSREPGYREPGYREPGYREPRSHEPGTSEARSSETHAAAQPLPAPPPFPSAQPFSSTPPPQPIADWPAPPPFPSTGNVPLSGNVPRSADATLVPPADDQPLPMIAPIVTAPPPPHFAEAPPGETAQTSVSATESPVAAPPPPSGPPPASRVSVLKASSEPPPQERRGRSRIWIGLGTAALLAAVGFWWPKAPREGRLVVLVDQQDPVVRVDDEPPSDLQMGMGFTRALPEGVHRVRVQKLGFHDYDERASVVAGETTDLVVRLKPIVHHAATSHAGTAAKTNTLLGQTPGGGSKAKELVDSVVKSPKALRVTPVPPQTATVGQRLSFAVQATDPNVPGGVMVYRLLPPSPTGAAVNALSGRVEWTPPPGAAREAPFRIQVSTSTRNVEAATIDVAVRVDPAAPSADSADDPWPALLGPTGDGVSRSKRLPLHWSESKNIAWKTAVHGRGWSSPVVWGDQVWLTTASDDGKKRFAVCYRKKTGETLHDVELFAGKVETTGRRKVATGFAGSSPTIEAGRVYVHFGRDGTAALDTATGRILWERTDVFPEDPLSPASSPTVFGDSLYVQMDGATHQVVAALDKNTGRDVWRKETPSDRRGEAGEAKASLSTPAVFEILGKRQLVVLSDGAVHAYEPATGALLWRFDGTGINPSSRPLWVDGAILAAAGPQSRITAFRPSTGELPGAAKKSLATPQGTLLWRKELGGAMHSSPAFADGKIFYLANEIGAGALDLRDGKPVWSRTLAGKMWASPLVAGGRLYCFNQEGRCSVLSTIDGSVLAENVLESGCRASPAASRDALYVRTITHLYRIEGAD